MTHSARLRIATLVSRILDPFVVFSVTAILALVRSDLSVSGKIQFLEVMALVIIAPPFVLLAWAVARKKITDWDISKRRQRPLALGVLLALTLVDLGIVRQFGDASLFHLFMLYFVWLTGFFSVTLFWKISGHLGAAALGCGLLIAWYGGYWYLSLALLPVLAWARIVRHDHTPMQTVAGALYSLTLVWLFHALSLI